MVVVGTVAREREGELFHSGAPAGPPLTPALSQRERG
jgi:hypothetical protein